jgi:hypothetical protein
VTTTGSIEGQTADLDPIDIVNAFGLDMRWGVGRPNYATGSRFSASTWSGPQQAQGQRSG